MPKIVPIVEGDGEITAVPSLIRRSLQESGRFDIQIARAKNAHGRGNLTRVGGLEKFVEYAWKEPDCGAIMIFLDSEGDCPVELARELSDRIGAMGIIFPVAIVIAHRMYESWFLASIESLRGNFDLPAHLDPPDDPEEVGNPKAWLNDHFPSGRGYKETIDQDSMTWLIDFALAQRARSFQRFQHALEEVLEAIDSGEIILTPEFA
jgi:hypothetical protein